MDLIWLVLYAIIHVKNVRMDWKLVVRRALVSLIDYSTNRQVDVTAKIVFMKQNQVVSQYAAHVIKHAKNVLELPLIIVQSAIQMILDILQRIKHLLGLVFVMILFPKIPLLLFVIIQAAIIRALIALEVLKYSVPHVVRTIKDILQVVPVHVQMGFIILVMLCVKRAIFRAPNAPLQIRVRNVCL